MFYYSTPMGNVFIISGPSGSGQDTIIEALKKELPLERVITTTTRAKRPNESDGHPYHFITKKAFAAGREANTFVECAETYNGEWYGVKREDLEAALASPNIVIWKMDYKGVTSVKKQFPLIKSFLIEAPAEVLRERLIKRDNPSEEYLQARMEYTHAWLASKELYDYCIKNEEGRLGEAVATLKTIIQEEVTKNQTA
jgi:guanylate kinase